MEVKVNISDLNKRQTDIVNDIIKSKGVTKYFVIRAGRQSGKTFCISRLAIYLCLKHPNTVNSFILAWHRQNKKVYTEMLKIIPEQIIKRTLNGDGERSIEFINGSVLHFLTASNYESIRGSTFDSVIGDEVAIWRPEALDIIKPTVAAKKDAIFVMSSTPKGRGPFYEEALKGMDPSNDFVKHYQMTYLDNDQYDMREIEEQRKSMSEVVFKQEYEGEFCFGKSSVFGTFSPHQTILKWSNPDPNELYFFGLDNSGSGEDFTVITIMNSKLQVCYQEILETMSIPDQVEYIGQIIKRWNATGYSEKNGIGAGISDYLKLNHINKVFDFWTSNESKQEMITKFLYALNSGQIGLPSGELCPVLENEMSIYSVQRTPTGKLNYSHPKGCHDDTVDSLLLAFIATQKLNGSNNGEIWDDKSPDYSNELYIPWSIRNLNETDY